MSKKKTIYVSGKVSGLNSIEASHKFGKKQKELMEQGHTTVVPLDIVPSGCTWEQAMKVCIPELLKCDEVHFLPCWSESRGAIMERDIAMRLNIPIVYC